MGKITESDSKYRHLERMPTAEILRAINHEDSTVPEAVAKVIDRLVELVELTASKIEAGGRLYYIGAGTSGRLGILDASECPPTFGVPDDWVVGLIAGGDGAIRKAVEFAEDNAMGGWEDLRRHGVGAGDVVVGLAASGATPYVVGALKECKKRGITTACVTCNTDAPIINQADYPLVIVVGPEVISGSTRMKAGTAQKLVLNMLSTAVMIRLGRVMDNKMVDMQLANNKLIERGIRMIQNHAETSYDDAKKLLLEKGSVRAAIQHLKNEGSSEA
jgi:N-acetylmuramic acid 6-phosphate etherase